MRRFDALPRTDPDSSFLPPFPIPFFISSSSCFLPNLYHSCFRFISYILSPFPSFLASYPLLIPYLLLSSLLLSDLFVCLYVGSVLPSLLPCWCLFFLTSFSRYLPPSFPFNLFLKVFYFLSKLLFPSLYLSFFPYPLSLSPSILFFLPCFLSPSLIL